MGIGGVSGYAAMNARVRSMLSTLITPEQFARLMEAQDFDTLITLLKRTAYGPYLEAVKDKDLSPRRAAFQIRERLAEAYTNIITTAPMNTRPLITQLYRSFEVDNLKAVLRGIVAGESWDRVRYLLFPMGPVTVLPAQAMMESGSVTAAVELLKNTVYYDTLSFAMRRFSAENNLFPLEVALDLNYWRDLWNSVSQLHGQDRTQALRIIGPLLDTTNLMWAIRYRVYHHLSEEELINYTLPFGYRVRDEDIRSIAAGGNIGRIVERDYPDIHNVEDLLSGSRSGLSVLEMQLQREVVRQCRAVLVGNPFHIGVPLAYLILQGMEIKDLTVLIEAKSNNVPAEEYTPYLLVEPEQSR
jgi:V/A-type H+/Na+-transporting ATPase subunit C